MTRAALLAVLALSSAAAADPANRVALTGAEARALTLGRELAGIPSTKDSNGLRYTVTQVSCTTTNGGVFDDGLDATSCQTGAGKALAVAPAAILSNAVEAALSAKGLELDTGMSKSTIRVASIVCSIAPDAKATNTADRFGCEVGLRQSLLITPKKPPKDLVQPVKIEKQ